MKQRRRIGITMLLALLISLFAMSVVTNAATVKLNKKKASITVGKTVQLKLANNKKKVTWSSSKKSVATVSSKGLVKGVKAGTAKITAKVGKKKYTCTVTVKKAAAAAASDVTVKFTNKSDKYLYGDREDDDEMTIDLSKYVDVTPASASLTWASSNTGVATVSSAGVVTAVADGTTKITVTAAGKAKASIAIKVSGMGKVNGKKIAVSKRNIAQYLTKVEVKKTYLDKDGKLLRYADIDFGDNVNVDDDYTSGGYSVDYYYVINNPSVNTLLTNAYVEIRYFRNQYNATLTNNVPMYSSLIKKNARGTSFGFSEMEFLKNGTTFTYTVREYSDNTDSYENKTYTGKVQVTYSVSGIEGKSLLAANYFDSSFTESETTDATSGNTTYTLKTMTVPSNETITSASGNIYLN